MPRAGLAPSSVTEAAAELADELDPERLSMALVADRLGVRGPSLYKHVDGLADLTHRVAVLSADELSDAIRDAVQGLAGRDALAAAAHAVRTYIAQHPGRYAATGRARPTGPTDPLAVAIDRALASFAAALRGYRLSPADEVHAIRTIRSALHGFATLEAAGGFRMQPDADDSFAWMIDFFDRGLTATGGA